MTNAARVRPPPPPPQGAIERFIKSLPRARAAAGDQRDHGVPAAAAAADREAPLFSHMPTQAEHAAYQSYYSQVAADNERRAAEERSGWCYWGGCLDSLYVWK